MAIAMPGASEDLRLVERADEGRVLHGVGGDADLEAPRAGLGRVLRGRAEQVVPVVSFDVRTSNQSFGGG
jgi:hypothetical protein